MSLPQKKHPALNFLSAILLHLCLTIVMTYPAALYFSTHFFGGARGDKFQFIWIFWWVKYSLFSLYQLPFFTDLLYHPTGVSLALHDMTYFWSFLSIPLQFFWEPGIVFNIFLLSCFPLNGLAFYYFARETTGSHLGAMAGSVLFAYCPYFLGRFTVAHIQYLGVFFIPLFFLELWRYKRSPGPGPMIKAALYVSLTSLISFYYGLALIAILTVFFFQHLLRSKPLWPDRAFWRGFGIHFGINAGICLVILTPFVLPILMQLKRGDFSQTTKQADPLYLEYSSGDLASYFLPDYTIASWRGWGITDGLTKKAQGLKSSLKGNVLEKAVYPGWISWMALVLFVMSSRLRKEGRVWIILFLCSFLFTLGPTLYVNGVPYLRGSLPASLLHGIPIFNIIRGTTRFAFFMTFASGMLIALGISRLTEYARVQLVRVLPWAVIVVSALDFIPRSLPVIPQDVFISPYYKTLRQAPSRGAILNIPVDFSGARGGGDIYEYAQTIHQKPMVGGYVSREPDYALETLRKSDFLQAVEHRRYEKNKRLKLGDAGFSDMDGALKELEVSHVVIHKPLLPGKELQRVTQWLEKELEKPVFEDSWIKVYSHNR